MSISSAHHSAAAEPVEYQIRCRMAQGGDNWQRWQSIDKSHYEQAMQRVQAEPDVQFRALAIYVAHDIPQASAVEPAEYQARWRSSGDHWHEWSRLSLATFNTLADRLDPETLADVQFRKLYTAPQDAPVNPVIAQLFDPARLPALRDEDGSVSHPDLDLVLVTDDDECDVTPFFNAAGLDLKTVASDDWPEDSDGGDINWFQPETPDGWRLVSLHSAQDGDAVAWFARLRGGSTPEDRANG